MEHLVYGGENILIITILAIIIIGIVIWYLIKNYKQLNNTIIISMSMILGGGIGNLMDRIFRGFVVDYIDINYLFKYPVFNLADICIVIGIGLIIINLIVKSLKEQENS